MPGTSPRERVRRLAFLPVSSRLATSMVTSLMVRFLPVSGLDEERTDARLLVDAADRLAEERRHRQRLQLRAGGDFLLDRRGVGDQDALERRAGDALQRRAREHAVDARRQHAPGALL